MQHTTTALFSAGITIHSGGPLLLPTHALRLWLGAAAVHSTPWPSPRCCVSCVQPSLQGARRHHGAFTLTLPFTLADTPSAASSCGPAPALTCLFRPLPCRPLPSTYCRLSASLPLKLQYSGCPLAQHTVISLGFHTTYTSQLSPATSHVRLASNTSRARPHYGCVPYTVS